MGDTVFIQTIIKPQYNNNLQTPSPMLKYLIDHNSLLFTQTSHNKDDIA